MLKPPGSVSGSSVYAAYGLGVRSFVPLPGTPRLAGEADVLVRRARLRAIAAELRASGSAARVFAGEVQLLLPGVCTLLIRSGREIQVDADSAADERLLQLALLGPAFAALLCQRGFLVLHASAVEMDGVAVAFLGGCGAGKSTIAAALHRHGHPLLADDLVAVLPGAAMPSVARGVPRLKLWPDALIALGEDPERLERIHPHFTKRWRPVGDGHESDSVPLGCLYVLARGEYLEMQPLSCGEAFLAIVKHSYGIRWLHGLNARKGFSVRARLARGVPVLRLQLPHDLGSVAELARTMEEKHGRR